MDIKLKIEHVFHSYSMGTEELKVLENINLDVYDNEILVLLGPSGCGKTTLLRIIAGFIKPTKGKVYCDGKEVTGPGPDRGYVFQEDAVFPWMNVEENVEFGLWCKGLPREERRKIADHFIKLVGLSGFEHALPKELSGGMLKRVDLARAYAIDPKVLLMDEPFGPLDAQTRLLMQNELSRIWSEEKKTIVFVTHDIEEAVYLADRIVIFSKRPAKIEKIIDVNCDRPRDRYSNKFLNLKREVAYALNIL